MIDVIKSGSSILYYNSLIRFVNDLPTEAEILMDEEVVSSYKKASFFIQEGPLDIYLMINKRISVDFILS